MCYRPSCQQNSSSYNLASTPNLIAGPEDIAFCTRDSDTSGLHHPNWLGRRSLWRLFRIYRFSVEPDGSRVSLTISRQTGVGRKRRTLSETDLWIVCKQKEWYNTGTWTWKVWTSSVSWCQRSLSNCSRQRWRYWVLNLDHSTASVKHSSIQTRTVITALVKDKTPIKSTECPADKTTKMMQQTPETNPRLTSLGTFCSAIVI